MAKVFLTHFGKKVSDVTNDISMSFYIINYVGQVDIGNGRGCDRRRVWWVKDGVVGNGGCMVGLCYRSSLRWSRAGPCACTHYMY